MTNDSDPGALILAAFMFAAYFAPSIIAVCRHARRRAGIGVVNLFFGWTLIGWVVAAAWAVSAEQEIATPKAAPESPRLRCVVGHYGDPAEPGEFVTTADDRCWFHPYRGGAPIYVGKGFQA